MVILPLIFVLLSSVSFFMNAKQFKNVIHRSWWASYQSALKNTDHASFWFGDVLSIDSSLCTHKGYIQHLYRHEQYHDLINYYRSKKQLFDRDSEIKKMYGLSLLRIGEIQSSDAILLELANNPYLDLEICFYAAQAAMRAKKYESALDLINRYLKDQNKEAGLFILYFLKSQLCLQLNAMTDAKAACQEAISLRPDFEKGWLLLAMLSEQEGDFSGAISNYNQYLALEGQETTSSDVYNGVLTAIARNFFLQQGQAKKHFNGPVVMSKAQTCFKNEQYSQALEYANQFLCDDPANLDMICLKLEALVELEKYDAVVACLLEEIERCPTNAKWYKVLGWAFQYGTIDHDVVINRLKQIQEKNKQTVLPGICMIDYYSTHQKFQDAENVFELLDQSITDPSLKGVVLLQRACLYKQQKKYDQMIFQLKNILSVQPDNHIVYELLVDHFIHEKDYANALDVMSQWRVLNALCPRALTKHGFVLYKQGMYDDAKELFTQAQIGGQSSLLLLYQAKLARKKGEYDHAYALCEQAKMNATTDELARINKLVGKLTISSPRQLTQEK